MNAASSVAARLQAAGDFAITGPAMHRRCRPPFPAPGSR